MVNIKHAKLKAWVDEITNICTPDAVVWVDGSEEEKKRLERRGVARTEHLTYICAKDKDAVGPTNNWMSPEEGYKKAREILKGSMKGHTLYVVPFSMGPVGSPFSKIGVELTDSIYVVLNMRIMTRIGQPVLDQLGADGDFVKCLHSKADLDVNKRMILHFPEDNTIWSVGSAYGGNALLGKKCLALRIASFLGKQQGWLAEHLSLIHITSPEGAVKDVAGAFPSACGKTNLAMLIPTIEGWKVETVGPV